MADDNVLEDLKENGEIGPRFFLTKTRGEGNIIIDRVYFFINLNAYMHLGLVK